MVLHWEGAERKTKPPPSVAPSILALLSCFIALSSRARRILLFGAVKQLRRARVDGATLRGVLVFFSSLFLLKGSN